MADEGWLASLDAVVGGLMARLEIPGATVGLLHGRALLTRGYGVLGCGRDEVVGDTAFRIGSISKVFTANAVVRLAIDRRFRLDQPVHELLPALVLGNEVAHRATVRELLSHQSGLDCDLATDWWQFDGPDAIASATDMLYALPSWFEPGRAWAYSNAGYLILGSLVEQVTSETFEEAMARLILRPRALSATLFVDGARRPAGTAVGHMSQAGRLAPVDFAHPRARRPSGGLVSTAGDLLRFASTHFADHHDRAFAEDARIMREAQCRSSWGSEWGCGWELPAEYGMDVLSHRGTVNGFQCQLVVVPTERFAAVVLTNSGRGAPAIRTIIPWLLETRIGVRARHREVIATNPEVLRAYSGFYSSADMSARVTLGPEGVIVEAEARPGAYTAFQGATREHAAPVGDGAFLLMTGELAGTCFDFLPGDPSPYLRYAGRILGRARPPRDAEGAALSDEGGRR